MADELKKLVDAENTRMLRGLNRPPVIEADGSGYNRSSLIKSCERAVIEAAVAYRTVAREYEEARCEGAFPMSGFIGSGPPDTADVLQARETFRAAVDALLKARGE